MVRGWLLPDDLPSPDTGVMTAARDGELVAAETQAEAAAAAAGGGAGSERLSVARWSSSSSRASTAVSCANTEFTNLQSVYSHYTILYTRTV